MKGKSLFLALLCKICDANGKNSSSALTLISEEWFVLLKITILSLFKFALAFTMSNVSGSDLHKHKKWFLESESSTKEV